MIVMKEVDMLKPYTRNQRIYDYIEENVCSYTEKEIIVKLLKHSLWEVVYDKQGTLGFHYIDRIELADRVRVVVRILEDDTELEVFSPKGYSIGHYFRDLYDYDLCTATGRMRIIMIDIDKSADKVVDIIDKITGDYV